MLMGLISVGSTGDWFCLLADDDVYRPDFLNDLLSMTEKYPTCDVFRSRVEIIDGVSKFVDFFPSSPELESAEEYLWHVLKNYRRQTISEWMIRTETIRKWGGYVYCPLAWGSDYLSILQFAASGGVVSSNRVNVMVRESGKNISSDNKGMYLVEKLKGTTLKYTIMEKWIMEYSTSSLRPILLQLSEQRRYDAKHWQLDEAGFSGLKKVFARRKEIYGVSGFVVFEHMISLLSRKVRGFLTGIYSRVKVLLRKMNNLRRR